MQHRLSFNLDLLQYHKMLHYILRDNQQIKSQLNILSPVLGIGTKGTNPTMELTSTAYKNEMEAKENRNKRKYPVFNLKIVEIEKLIPK